MSLVLLAGLLVAYFYYRPPPAVPAASLPMTLPPVSSAVDNPTDDAARTEILLAFNSGNYFEALELIETKLQHRGSSPSLQSWLAAQLPVALSAAGQLHIDLGDCHAGIAQLTRAVQLRRSTENMKGLAWCYYRQREFANALTWFSAYLQQRDDDVEMLLLYTDLLAELGEYERATSYLTRSITDAALPSTQQQRLQAHKTKLQAQQSAAEQQALMETNSFKISYHRYQHDELSIEAAATLDDALRYYVEHYGFAYPERKIAVMLYPSTLFRRLLPEQPHWVEGYFDGKIRIPIDIENFSLSKLRRTLRHELVHALLAQRSGFQRLPTWFDEGLAQYLSCLDACAPFSFPADGELLPPQVLQNSFLTLEQTKAQRAYHHSLFLVTMLEPERSSTSTLKTIIASLSPQHRLNSDALLATVAKNFSDFYRIARIRWRERQQHSSL